MSDLPQSEPQQPEAAKRVPWGKILVWGGFLVLLAIIGIALVKTQRGGIAIGGKVPPDLTMTDFSGRTYRLGDLRGKVVLINFWASWCNTCKDEAVMLEQAWEQYKDRGDVVFLGLDYVDTDPDALAYIKKYGITYPNGPDKATRWAQTFHLRGVPETYIVDRNGRLAYKKIGPFQSLQEILSALSLALEK